MKRLLLLLLMTSFQFPAVAEWKYEERIDAMTDETRRTAFVYNENGYKLSVYRIPGQTPVWGLFSLSDETFDQVDWVNPPMYRVDKNDPVELEKMRKLQQMSTELGIPTHSYEWKPKWVNFRLWDGDGDPTKSDNLLTQLMEGNKVVFRYYLSTGGHKETTFPLKGASAAFSKALSISSEIDHEAKQDSERYKNVLLEVSRKCTQEYKEHKDIDRYKSCSNKTTECYKSSDNDADIFLSCMQ